MKNSLCQIPIHLAAITLGVLCASAAEPLKHSFLATGGETRIVDGDGKTIWKYPGSTRDGCVLPNGNLLLAVSKNKDYPGGAVIEIKRDLTKVFEFKGTQSEVNTAQALPNGNIMLTEAGAKPRILEVNRKGKIIIDVPLQCQNANHHMESRMTRKLPNGNYLVPQLLDKVVREYTPEGKIVWEFKAPEDRKDGWPFTAIRLPVSWDQYADATTAKIEGAWLDRVKEVVDWCIDADLRVIVNIHWDGGWLEENVTPERQAANVDKQRAFWQQIATHLRDVDGRLMFAGANEPNVKTAEQMAVLMRYHQTFIDAVRATGGRNTWRTLIVQGPSTDVQLTSTLMTGWPTDTVAGRLMAEVHYYTPWGFAGQLKDESWGNAFYYWGAANHSATDTAHNPTWGEEATVDEMFGLMKQRFVDKGIPVIVGEFGAVSRTELTGEALQLHLAGRADYFKVVTRRALAHGLVPFYWDTGGLIDRTLNTVKDQQALDALMAGAAVP